MQKSLQPHINVDSIRKYVLLPGDPGRLDVISKFLTDVREIGFNREYRILDGKYNGLDVSVVSSGMGCPSAAIAVEELVNVGAKVIIRLGTCGGLLKEMSAGDIVIPDEVLCWDGTTQEYQKGIKTVNPDSEIKDLLEQNSKESKVKVFVGLNRTHDAYYESTENFLSLKGKGIISSEMEASAVLLVSKMRKVKAGCILVIKTPEPPEMVEKNPEMIYELINEKRVEEGMDIAIQSALSTFINLEK